MMYGFMFLVMMTLGGFFCGGIYGAKLAFGTCFFIAAFFLLYIMWSLLQVHIEKEIWGPHEREILGATEIAVNGHVTGVSPPSGDIITARIQDALNKRKLH